MFRFHQGFDCIHNGPRFPRDLISAWTDSQAVSSAEIRPQRLRHNSLGNAIHDSVCRQPGHLVDSTNQQTETTNGTPSFNKHGEQQRNNKGEGTTKATKGTPTFKTTKGTPTFQQQRGHPRSNNKGDTHVPTTKGTPTFTHKGETQREQTGHLVSEKTKGTPSFNKRDTQFLLTTVCVLSESRCSTA
jgi:hypothetical protein